MSKIQVRITVSYPILSHARNDTVKIWNSHNQPFAIIFLANNNFQVMSNVKLKSCDQAMTDLWKMKHRRKKTGRKKIFVKKKKSILILGIFKKYFIRGGKQHLFNYYFVLVFLKPDFVWSKKLFSVSKLSVKVLESHFLQVLYNTDLNIQVK